MAVFMKERRLARSPYPPCPGRLGLQARQGPAGHPGRLGTLDVNEQQQRILDQVKGLTLQQVIEWVTSTEYFVKYNEVVEEYLKDVIIWRNITGQRLVENGPRRGWLRLYLPVRASYDIATMIENLCNTARTFHFPIHLLMISW